MANKLVIERIFDAPVKLVWKFWSEPEMLKKWWGPKVFTCPVVRMDFRVGGKYLSCMRGIPAPGAPVQDFWSTGTYKEIIPPDPSLPSGYAKIVATDSFADEKGNVVSSTHYGMKGFPREMLITFEFEEVDGKTKLTLTHSGLEKVDEKSVEGMDQGWNESFDKVVENIRK